MSYHFQAEQWIPIPLEKVFRFFADSGNLPRLMPAWMGMELLRVKIVPPPGTEPVMATVTDWTPCAGAGSELVASYRAVPFLPFRITSVALITEFVMNENFADIQKEGPFRKWRHRHQFATEGAQWRKRHCHRGHCRLRDCLWPPRRHGAEVVCGTSDATHVCASSTSPEDSTDITA